ncbi:MAG: AAA family ATPase [Phycisphaerae bacterium]
MADLQEDLKLLIRTRHVIVTIQTLEEEFASHAISEAGREMGRVVMEWTVSDGLRRIVPASGSAMGGTQPLAGALRYIRDNPEPNVYVLKDSIRFCTDPAVERLFRDAAQTDCRDTRTLFLIDAGGELPASLQLVAVPYDLALPDEHEILDVVKQTAKQLTRYGELVVEMNRDDMAKFLSNLRGLTRQEISQVVADAVLGAGKISAADIARAIEAKRQWLRQTGVLDYIPPPESAPEVGGMDNLRRWLSRRAGAWTAQARDFGLESPRGILMLGVQGCGKSLMARYVAAFWRMPLLRMDVGALYDKYVGETERHLRTAFKVAAAMAPCVLWIDEVEKAFASAGTGAEGAKSDGGLSQRMFGMLLTWMQDRPDPVFIVATANDVTALPPELMRKGRFDEIFFVDLPDAGARKMIFSLHLARRKRDPGRFDLDALAAASAGFSGSEIEQAVVAAMYAAFAAKRDITADDILKELRATRPLSVVMAEKVEELRAWARGRCVPAD